MGAPKFANISDVIFAVAVSVADGAKIINLSLGGSAYSDVARNFYLELADEDVLIVAAAGNGGADVVGDDNDALPHYPSDYDSPAIISVAAINQLGELADFSNYGRTSVDIAAPGVNILMADITRKSVHQPAFSQALGGWATYRFTATDFSYARWGYYNGLLRDRIDGSSAYKPNTDTFLLSPEIDLSDSSGTLLEFVAGSSLSDDSAWVEASRDGFNWETVEVLARNGNKGYKVDLADYDFDTIRLRFRIKSNSYSQGAGVGIDGLKVTSVDILDQDNPTYSLNDGTSFAAPVVSGVAAMVWMHRPELTAAQVKAIILDSAKRSPGLMARCSPAAALMRKPRCGSRTCEPAMSFRPSWISQTGALIFRAHP
jgi:subtilisin family serine protease